MSLPEHFVNRRTVLGAGAAAAVGTGFGALGLPGAADATPGQIEDAKRRLTLQGYFCGAVDETLGDLTTCAVLAFQKANGMSADGRLDLDVMVALTRKHVPKTFTKKSWAVEVDLTKQLLRVVHDGHAVATLHASSGSSNDSTLQAPARTRAVTNRTPKGRFRLQPADEPGNTDTSLGTLYRPHYFRDEYAVYGRSDLATLRKASTLGGVAVHSTALQWLESQAHLPPDRLVVVG